MSCPALDSPLLFLGCKYLLNDLYNTHRPPLCRVLLAAQFADVIEGARRLPTPPPLLCNYQTIYQTWQAIGKPDKARCVAFKFCTRPGHLASGLQRWGLSLDFPFLVVVEYERLCNLHCDGTIFILLLHLPFCSFVWYDSKCKLVCFTI